MAMEPITIFSRNIAPKRIIECLIEMGLNPNLELEGTPDNWTLATLVFVDDDDNERLLHLNHDPDYYAEENFAPQMNGMANYFNNFPDSERKPIALGLIQTFKFSIATIFEPDFDPEGDPRLSVVCAVTKAIDGVLFTPSSLRDADGRVLYGADSPEAEDPDAKWPMVAGEFSITSGVGAEMHEMSRPKDEAPESDEAPSPERVARRALALAAITFRAVLEGDFDEDWAPSQLDDLKVWIGDLKLQDEFESSEWAEIETPLGKLDNQQVVNSTWRLEGLTVLAWALQRFEIPPIDVLVEMNPLWDSLNLLNSDAGCEFLESPNLRSRDEINTMRKRMFALHWRLRNFRVKPEAMNFVEFAQTAWFGPLDITGLPIVDYDLAIGGDTLAQADPELCDVATSASLERFGAINWLLEGPELYLDASVAT